MIKMLVYFETATDRVYPPKLERVSFFCSLLRSDQGCCLNNSVKYSFFSVGEKSSIKNPGPLLMPLIKFVQNDILKCGTFTSCDVLAVPPEPQQRNSFSTSSLMTTNDPPTIERSKLRSSL